MKMMEALNNDTIFRRDLLRRLDKIAEEIKESRKSITAKLEAIANRSK